MIARSANDSIAVRGGRFDIGGVAKLRIGTADRADVLQATCPSPAESASGEAKPTRLRVGHLHLQIADQHAAVGRSIRPGCADGPSTRGGRNRPGSDSTRVDRPHESFEIAARRPFRETRTEKGAAIRRQPCSLRIPECNRATRTDLDCSDTLATAAGCPAIDNTEPLVDAHHDHPVRHVPALRRAEVRQRLRVPGQANRTHGEQDHGAPLRAPCTMDSLDHRRTSLGVWIAAGNELSGTRRPAALPQDYDRPESGRRPRHGRERVAATSGMPVR
jgi:hypothetical protein